ncbi:hypothetical protein Droror1_Dr00000653 [Drosera rotundifolia]
MIKKGMSIEAACPLCDEEDETTTHVLIDCRLAKEVWDLGVFALEPKNDSECFRTLFTRQIDSFEGTKVEDFAAVMSSLWHNRNAKIHGDESKPTPLVYQLDIRSASDY